jgi:prepilin-type N-terminal cleavage/methylation domain-containing protein
MKAQINKQKGFTLIEMIVVLIIVGIIASLAGLGIVTVMRGYIFSSGNAAIAEKAQLAVSRINRELLECYNCSGASGANVSMPIYNPLGARCINLNANNIVIYPANGGVCASSTSDILLDGVNTLTMTYDTYNSASINVTLVLNLPGGSTKSFITKVLPRNTSS